MTQEMRFTPVFWKLYNAAAQCPRYISMPGGTRSGKTYSILQFLHLLIPKADKTGDVTSVVSETLPHLKRGAIRDFERIVGHPLKMDPRWNASENTYTYSNGAKLEFFSADSPGKVLGPARKRLFINECNHVPYETARQLFVRTTGIVILDYNPATTFWAIELIESRDNCVVIRSTYKDNTFLTKEQIYEIEANRNDANWWRVYGLGLTGQLEGVIYQFEQIDELPDTHGLIRIGGLDYGFSNSKTAGVDIYADIRRKRLYLDEMFYGLGMFNADIIDALERHGFPKGGPRLYADCAEPKANAEIKLAGFNVFPSYKGKEITFQVNWLQGWELMVTKTSTNMIHEFRNYLWATDRDGNKLNVPIKDFDHCMDAMRYGAFGQLADFRRPAQTTSRIHKVLR